jgi:hypothetical protein
VRSILGGLVWVSLAPIFYSAMSASAKLSGAYLNVWQIGAGRFLLGLIVVPVVVRALRISLWGQNHTKNCLAFCVWRIHRHYPHPLAGSIRRCS